jgi:tetratricopeptide (TPR) repeat protein
VSRTRASLALIAPWQALCRAALVLFVCLGVGARAGAAPRPYRLVDDAQVEEADRLLQQLSKSAPDRRDVQLLDGNLRFLHGDYAGAAAELAAAVRERRAGDPEDEAGVLAELAAATAAVTHGFVEARRPGGHFVVRHAPGRDAVLAEVALDALERAYAALAQDFGAIAPAEPVRVEIYPEVADLAKVSTLTLKEIETSGTIALCKFNRLMITSPRALLTGYPWIDTLTHEYTHFVVSRVSRNTVPIWLHEGLAKFEERRWRAGPGGGLTPSMEHLLATGLERKHLITFEEMSPSMAKLPSQDDTALAFAEVYTFVEYLHERVGWDGLRAIITRLRDGQSDAAATAQVVGRPFSDVQSDWRNWLRGRKLKRRPGLFPTALKFKKGAGEPTPASEDDSGDIVEEKARRHARLGGLLRARHRLRAAAMEYEKAQAAAGAGHPLIANKLARTYLELGEADRAVAAAQPALSLYPEQAAPNATIGEAYLRKGDVARAQPFLEAALRVSPFDPLVRCGLERVYQGAHDARAAREAEACRLLGGR